MTEHVVARLAELPPGTSNAFVVDGVDIAVFHTTTGALHAISAYCTHQDGPMAAGYIDDGVVLCPVHLMGFCLQTGESHDGQPPIAVYPARVDDDGRIVVEI